jgi:hypothetical protein
MSRSPHFAAIFSVLAALALAPAAHAQRRPHIGYVYPAGAQQSTTVQLKLGGQDLDGVEGVLVTGTGVNGKIIEYFRRISNQDVQLLNEQLKELKRKPAAGAQPMMAESPPMMDTMMEQKTPASQTKPSKAPSLIERIEKRISEYVQTPACASISAIVLVEVTLAADAAPGPRELRLITARGVSNPLPFHVGQVPESTREAMQTARLQVLGKEATALRKRPPDQAEKRITLPCTVNGQIASGEVNRYRFQAQKGQQLVISTFARQLIPYVADAVPGWFQPVLALTDANGREIAYSDDYRFRPDPVILFEVPADGEYVFSIRDGIYRGREDFIYRITAGELPFITSIFPLGGPAAGAPTPAMTGWRLANAKLDTPPTATGPAIGSLTATQPGCVSNQIPFALGTLPEETERESSDATNAQPVALPIIINGRIDRKDDWDVFQFTGKANDPIVIEVQARRLDSPLDSVIKLTDATGKVLAFNDDCEDLTAGTNTHHADSYLLTQLPADGTYFVHLGDTARSGGEAYGYRLRISAPQPDFELRVVPSSVSFPLKSGATVSVYALRKDGFTGPIKVTLNNPPPSLSASPVVIPANQLLAKFYIKSGPNPTNGPIHLSIIGSAGPETQAIIREAIPAEDRMQAFLWRHLVPANHLEVFVYDQKYQPKPKRTAPVRPTPPPNGALASAGGSTTPPPAPAPTNPPPNATPPTPPPAGTPPAAGAQATPPKPAFSKQQIVGRLRQLKLLYEEDLLTDAFYDTKVTECEAAQ